VTKQIVVIGSPTEGYTFHGPFDTIEEAEAWADQLKSYDSWWVADLMEVKS
jgi:hypothetical protein